MYCLDVTICNTAYKFYKL